MKILLLNQTGKYSDGFINELRKEKFAVDIWNNANKKEDEVINSANDYDLMILDYNLHGETGSVQLCKKIRDNQIAVPIICIGNLFELNFDSSVFESSSTDFVGRPFSFFELIVRIKFLLRSKLFVQPKKVSLSMSV